MVFDLVLGGGAWSACSGAQVFGYPSCTKFTILYHIFQCLKNDRKGQD